MNPLIERSIASVVSRPVRQRSKIEKALIGCSQGPNKSACRTIPRLFQTLAGATAKIGHPKQRLFRDAMQNAFRVSRNIQYEFIHVLGYYRFRFIFTCPSSFTAFIASHE